jgi:hypothetical protein
MSIASVVYQEGNYKIMKDSNGYSLWEDDEFIMQDKMRYKLMPALRRKLKSDAALRVANSQSLI